MSWYSALALLILALILVLIFDRLARVRRNDGERGDYWSAVVKRLCLALLPALFLSGSLAEMYRPLWQEGYHLHFDLSGFFGWSFGASFVLALALPFAIWLLLLAFGLFEKPCGREGGKWLAGSIGYGSSRWWVLFCILPLLGILAATFGDLNVGSTGYPAANWSTVVVLIASLVGVAFSAGSAVHKNAAAATVAAPASLPPWPETMRAGGIDLDRIRSFPASPAQRKARGEAAQLLNRKLERMGARELAPELVEAVEALIHPSATGDGLGPARLVFAPDDCGQIEVVAAAAERVNQRYRAATLVIVARGAKELCTRLAKWLPRGRRTSVVDAESETELDSMIWVTDAETLSLRLLRIFKGRRLIDRVGLVVWWGLEDYTGVLGANLWAISRRLHRLIRLSGRADVRTLALARRPAHADAQMGEFVARLLPHVFPRETIVFVEPRFCRPVEVHRLVSQQRLLSAASPDRPALSLAPHPSLGATKVSVDSGWPTRFELPPEITDTEAEALLQLPSGESTIRERVVAGSAEAGARLVHIGVSEGLAVTDLLAQGGRSSLITPHHVALTTDPNPYLAFLLSQLGGLEGRPTLDTARRLVCAEAHRDVLRYHLVLALNEHSETRQELLRNFRLDEATIAETLREIAHQGNLSQREVRALSPRQQLVIDQQYESRRLPDSGERPLDVVGTRLVRVLDRATGHQNEGVRMWLDPERLTIQAYPHRRFLYHGRRYRINVWESPAEVAQSGELHCEQDSVLSWTWRLRNLLVFGLEKAGPEFSVGRSGRLLSCRPVNLQYEEEVTGAVRVMGDAGGAAFSPEVLKLPRELAVHFATRGLILRFPDTTDGMALRSLAQALRHVLPVHLGVEEDAVEVVPLRGTPIEHQEIFGLAIVDLYPHGIGLVDAIRNDADFLLKMLMFTKSWLDAVGDDCLHTPAALAANFGNWPQRSSALKLLRQLL